jgi:hypothetical protein
VVSGACFEVRVLEAQLVRIFDSLKPNQDVFVQLVRCSSDLAGDEHVLGRTENCRHAELHPRWDSASFLCPDCLRPGDTLKFRVQVDHIVRTPTLCGEAEFSVDLLRSKAELGGQSVSVPLFKRGEQTGVLQIRIASVPQGVVKTNRASGTCSISYAMGCSKASSLELGTAADASPASTVYVSGLSEKWWDSFIDRG